MARAYDTTWRRGILNVIHDMGPRGSVAFFIGNFLRDCIFRTRIGQQYSSEHLQEDGVPQGSVLSCTLFSFAMNHIANNLPRDVSSSLSSSSHLPALEKRLQLAINAISNWSISHGFTIAHTDKKTVAIHLTENEAIPNHRYFSKIEWLTSSQTLNS